MKQLEFRNRGQEIMDAIIQQFGAVASEDFITDIFNCAVEYLKEESMDSTSSEK